MSPVDADDAWRLTDRDPAVRVAYVAELPEGLEDPGPDHPNVRALLGAFDDPDDDVRDWAVFGLGVQLDVDTPEIREALYRMLGDTGEADAAGEAAVALAKRGDPRILDVLLTALADPEVGNLYVEAAAELGDPRLLPVLEALRDAGWPDADEPRPGILDEAIDECGG